MAKVLFKNVNVLDCSGAPPFSGQVLVAKDLMEPRWHRGFLLPISWLAPGVGRRAVGSSEGEMMDMGRGDSDIK